MKNFENAKAEFDAIPIPDELSERVKEGVRQGRARRRTHRTLRRWMTTAACFVLLVAGLNLSPTFAKAAANVPVLGGLFQVLTVVQYDETNDGIHYNVSVPKVEAGSGLAQAVNDAIQNRVQRLMLKARRDWDEYRDAFFATGGTEEEWGGREMEVIVDYDIKSQSDSRVSFVVTFAEGWVAFYEERYYYNLDLAEGRDLTIRDFLGEDWVDVCNRAIQKQIDESVDDEGFTYFFPPEEGGFTTVDESTGFYVREDGVVVVCFPEYAIAAGAAGSPEFPIA